jgi:protein-disulfide isomerase
VSKRVAGKNSNRVVREQLAAERRRKRTIWISVTAVAVLVIAAIVGLSLYNRDKPTQIALPAGTVDDGGAHSGLVAAGDGPVRVEVYFDFLCPFCKQFEATVTPTLDQLVAAKKITLIWHPLGFLDANSRPAGYSTHAAASAGCAADASTGNSAGKLKSYGQGLFDNQPAEGSAGLTDDRIIEIAGSAGIINPAFATCVRSGKYTAWVNQNNEDAARRGVTATPTVLVNGKVVTPPTADAITAAVTAAS